MELSKTLTRVRIQSCEEFFLHLYGFMLLSGSIESGNHNEAIETFHKRLNKELQRKFLHLYGFMV